MSTTEIWTWGLLGAGVFVAVSGLVHLMRCRRDELIAQLGSQVREEQQQKKLAEMLEKKRQKRGAS